MTNQELRELEAYRRRLQQEYDSRDYSAYGPAAAEIRKADQIFIGKVEVAIITRTPVWS